MIGLPKTIWQINSKKRAAVPISEESVFGQIREGKITYEEGYRNRVNFVPGLDGVLIAKPSPKPFSASLGTVSEVPNDPGLVFPYFQGMISCDTRGLRILVGDLFFRNFGDHTDSDARKGFNEFRDSAGIIANSAMGPIIAHILKGFELALDAQAHAFLIFDDSTYLGFALLGNHYWVHTGKEWIVPLEADVLRAELRELQTHETMLEGIVELLLQMVDISGDGMVVELEDIKTPKGLLDTLAEVDEDQGDKVKMLGSLLGGLKFKGGFKEISPENVVWALSSLTDNRHSDLGDLNLYIPLSGWSECASREYQVFAAFGPRAFHLQNKRGQKVVVPRRDGDVDPLGAVSGNPPVPIYPRFLVYPCIISEAVKKWKTFLTDGLICMDFDERARGSRAISWEGRNRAMVWDKIKEIGRGDYIHEPVGPGQSSGNGKKRARPSDFDDGEFEDIFA